MQAHTHLHEVMTIVAAVNYRVMLGIWQPLLGLVTLYRGDIPEARRLLTESLHLCLELKNESFLAQVCICLAETTLWEGELPQAAHWLAQNLAYSANPQRISVYEVARFWVADRLATAQQQYPRAAMLFGQADQLHSQINYAIAGPMHNLAEVALATVRAALAPVSFAETFTAGQQMALEEAFATVLVPTLDTVLLHPT